MADVGERSYVEEARREKRAKLEAMGVAPFAYRYARTHTAAEALAAYDPAMGDDGPEAAVAGRIVSYRSQGKTAFAHVEDATGRLQLYFRLDALGPAFEVVKLLDLDDHIGAKGRLFRTRTGETTLRVPAGSWRVVVSHGYEYEIDEQDVEVGAGATAQVTSTLAHVVDTTGQLCADFHIHTIRSNDSGDDAALKLRQGVADGLELPVRSDHEHVDDFQSIIEDLTREDS